jgi:hypothetical protein
LLTNKNTKGQEYNENSITITTSDDRTRLQALSLINDCTKYKMDLTTNSVVVTDAIKFVHTNKEKLSMSTNEENKESNELDYDENKEQLEGKQEKETENQEITNQVF